jgi:hypothetical protein
MHFLSISEEERRRGSGNGGRRRRRRGSNHAENGGQQRARGICISAVVYTFAAILFLYLFIHIFTLCVQGMPLSFDTSHNKKVEGNYAGLVKRDTKRSARQYMNRIGDSLFSTTSRPYLSL